MNHCQYDRNLDEPCGKPAGIKLINLWPCAEHADWTESFLYVFDPNVSTEERKRRQQGKFGWWKEQSWTKAAR